MRDDIFFFFRRRLLGTGAALGATAAGQHYTSAGGDSHGCREAVPYAMDRGTACCNAERELRYICSWYGVMNSLIEHVCGGGGGGGIALTLEAALYDTRLQLVLIIFRLALLLCPSLFLETAELHGGSGTKDS